MTLAPASAEWQRRRHEIQFSWATGRSPLFGCGGGLPIYTQAGTSTTDAMGQGRLEGGYPYTVLVVGDGGERALDWLRPGDVAKTVSLLPAVDLDIELTCGGQPCHEVDARGQIARNGGECALAFYPPKGGPMRLEIAKVPQGELELQIQTDRWTPREGRLVHRTPLAADLRTVLDVPIIGGPHALHGSVRFPDGAPPGGQSHYTTVRVSCDNGLERHTSPEPSNGAFTVTALSPVPCRIWAEHAGARAGRWLAPAVNVIPGSGTAARLVLQQHNPN